MRARNKLLKEHRRPIDSPMNIEHTGHRPAETRSTEVTTYSKPRSHSAKEHHSESIEVLETGIPILPAKQRPVLEPMIHIKEGTIVV